MRSSFFRQASSWGLPALMAASALGFIADDGFSKKLVELFLTYSRERPTEKVYIQTDRDAYLTGETIWLKGYLVNGTTHEADTISRVLYVDLVDPIARRVRLRAQLRATDGYASGQLLLPDSLAGGTYQLRGYTNFMRNEPEAYYFTKTLDILPASASVSSSPTSNPKPELPNRPANRLDVQFLPEGGQLVTGMESRVAFKAINALELGVSVKGFVLNAKKDTITGFASSRLGMGYFTIKPESGGRYTAFVQSGDGTTVPYTIPAAQAQGVVMQVDNISRADQVKVYVRHNKTDDDAAAALTLLAQTRGQPVHVVSIPLSKKRHWSNCPELSFPKVLRKSRYLTRRTSP